MYITVWAWLYTSGSNIYNSCLKILPAPQNKLHRRQRIHWECAVKLTIQLTLSYQALTMLLQQLRFQQMQRSLKLNEKKQCVLTIDKLSVSCGNSTYWRRSMGRVLVSAGELSLSCARLIAGRVITLWLSRPLSVSQHGQLSHPSLMGR